MQRVEQMKNQLRRVLLSELVIIILIAVAAQILSIASLRVLVTGALVGWLGSSSYGYLALRFSRPGSPDRIYQGFSRASLVKWTVVIAGLSLALSTTPKAYAIWVIAGFIAQTLIHGIWVARLGHNHQANA